MPPGSRYDALQYGGPSPADFTAVANEQIPHYVIDADYIYKIPVGTTAQNWQAGVKKWRRKPTGTCARY